MTAREEFARGFKTLIACSIGYGSGLGGLAYYTFGVFVLPLNDAFGWSVGQVTLGSSCLIIGTAITAPIVGSFIDRYGAYRVALISMTAVGVGFTLLTQLSGAIAWFYVSWIVLSLAGGGTTPVVWTRSVNLWFDKGRGLALGAALGGSGLVGILAPPLTTKAIQNWGWQGGYLVIGIFILVVTLPLLFVLFKDRPDEPLAPAGALSAPPSAPGMTAEAALRHPHFWKIALGFFLVSGVIAGLIINLVKLLVERGLDRAEAAEIASVLGMAVLIGRIGIGYLLDRLSAPLLAGVLLGLCALGCYLMSVPNVPIWLISLCVIALGLGAAAEVDLVAYLTSRYLGMKAYGRIYGFQLTSFYLGAAIGPAAMGASFDHFKSYTPALYFSVGGLLFGALVLTTLGRPPAFGARHGS